MSEKELVLSFEPNTIEHLGVKMYSHIPPALAELIANAYDACAKTVNIELYDGSDRRVVVVDDGTGMTFDEINHYFLRIGRNRRKEKQDPPCGREPTGKKGLGKLALFGIGDLIEIETVKNGESVQFILDWNQILSWEDRNYTPQFKTGKADKITSGTKITLSHLKRVSDFSIEEYSKSIARLFNFQDETFKVYLSLNDGDKVLIDSKLKYQNIDPEFEWNFSEVVSLFESSYPRKNELVGRIITTEKPLKPGLRGITLFSNGRMVNAPEFFGRSESSHFFSYTTGWLDIDFIDDQDDDLISTDRQSISWEHEITVPLRVFLSNCLRVLETDWREKRKVKRRDEVRERTNVDINSWLKTIPEDIAKKLDVIVNNIDNSQLTSEEQSQTMLNLHSIIPEYPYYHWRHLHDKIKSVSKEDYEKEDYLRAAIEAIKKFEQLVALKTGLSKSGFNLMETAFGSDNSVLLITKNVSRSERDLENGHESLSKGVIQGFRNPVQHELKTSVFPDIFDGKDCLDILSLTSYLVKKLEQSKLRE